MPLSSVPCSTNAAEGPLLSSVRVEDLRCTNKGETEPLAQFIFSGAKSNVSKYQSYFNLLLRGKKSQVPPTLKPSGSLQPLLE